MKIMLTLTIGLEVSTAMMSLAQEHKFPKTPSQLAGPGSEESSDNQRLEATLRIPLYLNRMECYENAWHVDLAQEPD